MSISGKSRIYGLLGDPVAHSLSPLMHNTAFSQQNIDAVYVPFHVSPQQLAPAIDGLRALNVAGVNVTIPHKETILPFLDEVDPVARLIGAVNTVVNNSGKLIGYNTDTSGFIRAIHQELNFNPKNRTILLLGAGGACRAAAVGLASTGVKSIIIANRQLSRAEILIDHLRPHFSSVHFKASNYNDNSYIEALSTADLIVNTTSVGLKKEKLNFLPLEDIKGGALIYDMIYSLPETPLIRSVRSMGLLGADGLGMLAAQGEDAFFLWTGIKLPTGYMRKILMESSVK